MSTRELSQSKQEIKENTWVILLDPLNRPYLMTDLNTGLVKFNDEKIAHREAIKYVNQYGTNKTYMVINLNNCVDLG